MLRAVAAALFLLAPIALFAQSADQEVVSVGDSPDPVTPGSMLSYTVTLRNNGPDPATNGGINFNLDGNVTYQNTVAPAGFTCAVLGSNGSCTTPSFPVGTVVFTINVQVAASLVSFPDGTLTSNFFPSGTTADPNNGNNSKSSTTAYDSPQIDLALTVADAPDPVTPNNNVTYTVPVINNGPNTATSVNFNAFNNGSMKFQSATVPNGWNCTLPAVNGNPTFTCTIASLASGAGGTFIVVTRADPAILGLNDGTIQQFFGINGTGNETNNGNNSETESTAYVTPDADMRVTVSDSPDPVSPDGNITYTVTVTNAGPDTAANAALNSFNSGTLRFQSAVVPAGWNCSLPAVNATPTFTCTNPTFANGGNSVFTVVVRADSTVLGINDSTVSTNFSVSSSAADPVSANSSETEDTAYVTPDANMAVTASDSPDPVQNNSNLTYSIAVTNGGPSAATNAQLSVSPHASLTFQSITAPGWSCTTPAVNASGPITCTNASLANGVTTNFTLVEKLVASGSGGTISSTFAVSSSLEDPVSSNNSVQVSTAWNSQSADLSITKTTPATSAPQGTTITYTITAANAGPDAASNVVVTDALPASLQFQSITTPSGFSCTTPAIGATGTITCTAASLANGAAASFTLVVRVASGSGAINNSASIASSTFDPNSGNAQGVSAPVAATPASADLALTTAANSPIATKGSTLTYTITVHNNGPSPATNVSLLDTLPPGLTFVSATPSQGTCNSASPVSCSLGTLASGGTATVTLMAQVTAMSGTITNSASVSATEGDPNGGNNSGSTPPLPVLSTEEIPALSEYALLALVAALIAVAAWRSS